MQTAGTIIFTITFLIPLCAYSQSAAPPGFSFHRDSENHVTVFYSGNSGLRNGKLSELHRLRSVNISYGTKLTSDDLAYLSTLVNLKGIRIGQEIFDSPIIIEGDLSKLGSMKSLEWVHLCKHDIKDSDLKFIASLPKITELVFNAESELQSGGSAVSDLCADYLCRAKTLESIYVQGYGKLTDEFVLKIADGLPNLKHLDLSCPNLTDKSLRFLAKRCKKLRWLNVHSNRFTDQGVQQLSTAEHLEILWLDSNALTENCVESVAALQKLRQLKLTVPTITDRGVQVLANLGRLELIILRQPPLTDAQFRMFQNHPTLESGFINGEKMSIESVIKVIDTIPNLRHLSVGTRASDLQAAVNRALATKSHSQSASKK